MAVNIRESCLRLGCDVTTSGWPDKFGRAIWENTTKADRISGKDAIQILSLFSGAGGLDIGFHDAGFEIVESVEIEKKFCATLRANSGAGKLFSDSQVNCLDIREYEPPSKHIDFIIGGPPCQTFSAAGRRANGVLGTTDARGVLFREYIRLLKAIKPVGFLFENVYGIVGAQNGGPWKEILSGFSEAGYQLQYRILDAADYGAPQHRERLIIVGLKDGTFSFPKPLFGPDSNEAVPFYNAGLAIKNAPNKAMDIPDEIGGRYGDLIPAIPPGLNYSYYTAEMGNPQPVFAWRSKFSDFMYKADPDMPVRTIKAQGGQYTGPFHWDGRHFSVPEYKRLQTFPDTYRISGGRQVQIQQIGNSVPPQLARILALSIRKQVFRRSVPVEIDVLAEDEELGFRKRKRSLTALYREKAAEALHAARLTESSRGLLSSYTASIGTDFAFGRSTDDTGGYRVDIDCSDDKILIIEVNERMTSKAVRRYELDICPQPTWSIPLKEIHGMGRGSDDLTLTVLWKAIEQALVDMGLKADLVQLSGYYQYQSDMKCNLAITPDNALTKILDSVTAGELTRTMMRTSDFAEHIGMETSKVAGIARKLRKLGYEVRNWNTNSQIPRGSWIVPYEFPTLTPMSIQLRKQL